jgi:hypothetical protein
MLSGLNLKLTQCYEGHDKGLYKFSDKIFQYLFVDRLNTEFKYI